MAMDTSGLPFPKPEPRSRVKARRRRQESKVVSEVRAKVVARDGYCRLAGVPMLGPCKGPSEWAHFEEHKRFKTRRKPPEERHTTAGSLMLCDGHHDRYDLNQIEMRAMTTCGCDGALAARPAGEDEWYVERLTPRRES